MLWFVLFRLMKGEKFVKNVNKNKYNIYVTIPSAA